jgi:hypothetical protein
MTGITFTLQEDFWESVSVENEDIEFLYNHLLEFETPRTADELAGFLIEEKVRREKQAIKEKRSAGGDIYYPKNEYEVGANIIFPSQGWTKGVVTNKRSGYNPEIDTLEVIQVEFETGKTGEFASRLADHLLNDPPTIQDDEGLLDPQGVIDSFGEDITDKIHERLKDSDEFVEIAGRWFPKALLVEINVGHLNLAEAILEMEGGGPLPTKKLLETVDLSQEINDTLAEFSLDYALWKDERFDEVGPAGEIQWYLRRLEPKQVQETPSHLRYYKIDYEPEDLSEDMQILEISLDDELSELDMPPVTRDAVEIKLIYPHWRAGTLPLSSRLKLLLPTAYQAPRIRFILVDGETGQKFPGWVVQSEKYVFGLAEFYQEKGLFPGSLLTIRRSEVPGEVIVETETGREVREWLRTVLIGSDGNIVLAMLKQNVRSGFDDRMAISVPDPDALDTVWQKNRKERTPFEKIVVKTLRELSKLTPQGNVHASELYAAVNLSRRTPPGPILALLNGRPWFNHVGDLYFKLDEAANQ